MKRPEPGKISIKLKLDNPRKIPPEYRGRWKKLIKSTSYDAPYLIFLAELLGIINNDPAPAFTSSRYSDVDMFGGCDQTWSITSKDSCIYRTIAQEISESLQRVEVERDEISIWGLPGEIYIKWDGSWNWGLNLEVGNIENYQEEKIALLARGLFSSVDMEKKETDVRGRLRSDLLREYENRGSGGSYSQGSDEDQEALTSLLEDKDYKVAVAALNRLKNAGLFSKPAIRDAVLRALRNGENITCWTIAEMLGEERSRHCLIPLARALWDENETVREKAVEAIKQIGDSDGAAPLTLLFEDSSAQIRKAALSAVMKLASPEMLPVITELAIPLLKDENRYVREITSYLLMNHYDEKLVEPFIECLKDKNSSVRQWAAFGLGEWREERALPGLAGLLDDNENSVVLYAIDALGKIGGSEARDAMSRLLELQNKYGKYGNSQIRESIINQLKRIDDGKKAPGKKAQKKKSPEMKKRTKRRKNDFLYLRNFYYFRRVLEYDRKDGPRFEIHQKMLPEGSKTEGFHIEKKGRLYGVRPSSEGPVFFADEQEFPLKKNVDRGVFNREGKISSFRLERENRVVFSVEYEFAILEEFDMYSGEQEDFFDWLSGELEKEHFFEFYTTGS